MPVYRLNVARDTLPCGYFPGNTVTIICNLLMAGYSDQFHFFCVLMQRIEVT